MVRRGIHFGYCVIYLCASDANFRDTKNQKYGSGMNSDFGNVNSSTFDTLKLAMLNLVKMGGTMRAYVDSQSTFLLYHFNYTVKHRLQLL